VKRLLTTAAISLALLGSAHAGEPVVNDCDSPIPSHLVNNENWKSERNLRCRLQATAGKTKATRNYDGVTYDVTKAIRIDNSTDKTVNYALVGCDFFMGRKTALQKLRYGLYPSRAIQLRRS
jgi:hypothetical protein